ncbi:spore protease YyaC [Cohnella terricola]|uniref:Spore protease YyaC n=1 Tax=Cohnella terricola TaxID=1289167 RepID=A0A559J6J7_9BACL|nr:spore protease YyaC [Cohnella terricola]TVX95510.1 spore protease YyaC [Cohnella terricola]
MIDRLPQQAERVDAAGLEVFLSRIFDTLAMEKITFLCIGTDRSTGDSLGPLVGTLLEERGVGRVIGTLQNPCDANRLPQLIPTLPELGAVLAIDACLGKPENVGTFLVRHGPLIPAQSVGRGFGDVGAYSIAGVVNANSLKPYWTLQSTSLYRVMGMAEEIAGAIVRQRRTPIERMKGHE